MNATLDEDDLLQSLAEARRMRSQATRDGETELANVYGYSVRIIEDALMHFRIARSRIDRLAGC